MNRHSLRPNRPVDTFEGFKKGDFHLVEKLNCGKVEFYEQIPSIKDMPKYKDYKVQTYFKGGETNGLEIMEKYMQDKQRVASFRKPMTIPTSLKPDTTALSPYIKFGSLSSRTFFWAI
jgi:deoxyribodipyrimidine photolyase